MKYYLLSGLFFLQSIFLFSQTEKENDFFRSYLLFQKARISIYKKDYKQALEQCEQAFANMDYIATSELYFVTICAALTYDTNKMFSYMEMTLKRGVLFSQYEENISAFAPYMALPKWQELKNNQQNYYLQYESSINKEYKRTLDSLDREDHKVRRFLVGGKKINKKKLRRLQYVDSSAIALFYQWYDKYGYPYEGNIGKPELGHSVFFGYMFLYHHHIDSGLLAIQRQAVIEGKMQLHQYERKLNYINMVNKEPLAFKPPLTPLDTLIIAFAWWSRPKNEQDYQLANSIRNAIDYPSIEEEMNLQKQYTEEPVNYYFFDTWGWSKLGKKKK